MPESVAISTELPDGPVLSDSELALHYRLPKATVAIRLEGMSCGWRGLENLYRRADLALLDWFIRNEDQA